MADTRPTRLPWYRLVWLCVLGIFSPDRLTAEQERDNQARKSFTDPAPHEPPARVVRRAFWSSLALVVGSAGGGYLLGCLSQAVGFCTPSALIAVVQGCGAAVLLWGTLFVRGWDIQTYAGVTLVERVNWWLYRAMYCTGTALLVGSLPLAPCSG